MLLKIQLFSFQGGGGLLGYILGKFEKALSKYLTKIMLVSVENPTLISNKIKNANEKKRRCSKSQAQKVDDSWHGLATKIWISGWSDRSYVNPIKFKGLLELELINVSFKNFICYLICFFFFLI